ncbi:MAG: alpha/beta fold hydrolase [Chloroflexi bacterium]|nr:alpha/beta fold hydrolase [Chloroflexota bacterium]
MDSKMSKCPKCASDNVYVKNGDAVGFDVYLKVGLGFGMKSTGEWVTYLCTDCGYLKLFDQARMADKDQNRPSRHRMAQIGMTSQSAEALRNPHLDGDAFFLKAGESGALLVHGYTATTAEVRLLGQYLHEHGCTVSAPLLPGHGTTPQDMNRMRWRDWVGEVERAYTALAEGCRRVFVCGESMGALLALYLASEHPEIAGVAAFAPALLLRNNAATMRRARLLHRFVPFVRKPVREPSAADTRWKGYSVNPVPALVQLGLLQNEVRRRLGAIRQPVLVVQGRLDQTIDPRSGAEVLQNVSSKVKELRWLECSTHCVILDQEWELAAEMTARFLETTSPLPIEHQGAND